MPRRPSDGWTSDRFTGFIFRNSISRIFRIASPPTEEPRSNAKVETKGGQSAGRKKTMSPNWLTSTSGLRSKSLLRSARVSFLKNLPICWRETPLSDSARSDRATQSPQRDSAQTLRVPFSPVRHRVRILLLPSVSRRAFPAKPFQSPVIQPTAEHDTDSHSVK
jgi:hypothetical protein